MMRAICTSATLALRVVPVIFECGVIDARFTGLQHIARHRLVYNAVSDWMPARVHALNIIAMTPEETGTLIDHAVESF